MPGPSIVIGPLVLFSGEVNRAVQGIYHIFSPNSRASSHRLPLRIYRKFVAQTKMARLKQIVFLIAFLFSIGLFAGFEYQCEFSQDRGASWQNDFPILSRGERQVWMRISGRVVNEDFDYIVHKRVDSRLMGKKNYASALHGKADWAGTSVFVQLPDQAECDVRRPFTFLYKMDFSERGEVESDKKEIPAATKWKPGTYAMLLLLHYTKQKSKEEKKQIVFEKITLVITVED